MPPHLANDCIAGIVCISSVGQVCPTDKLVMISSLPPKGHPEPVSVALHGKV